MMTLELRHAETDGDIVTCFTVLQELRPSLEDGAELVGRVRRQQEAGYRLLAAWDGARMVGAAGYRIQENLVRGRYVYVDDLVVIDEARRFGLGARLLKEVARFGRDVGCIWLALDTGLGNALAQRFYFRQGLLATGLHFGMALD